MGEQPVSGAVRTHIALQVKFLYGCSLWYCKTIMIVTSEITDHHNRYNNYLKIWNIQNITKMWHRNTKWATAIGETAHGLAPCTVAADLTFVKNMMSQSALKWSATKHSLPLSLIYRRGNWSSRRPSHTEVTQLGTCRVWNQGHVTEPCPCPQDLLHLC